MQGQQVFFDKLMAKAALAAAALQASFETQLAKATLAASEQMAKAALAASNQKASFEHQMAKAEQTMGSMKIAHEKLECENADQKKTAAQVWAGCCKTLPGA